MFGHRPQRPEEPEEAVRERERRALFAELAKRPETVCPFLGLAGDRAGFHDGVTPEHRCYAFGEPADLSSEQQERVCLQRGYGNCPRYLRGVLVIPTEELEALRRPQAAALPPAPPQPKVAQPFARQRGRGAALALALVVLTAGGVGAGILLLGNKGAAVVPTPTVTPTPELSVEPTASASPDLASFTPAPEPTPGPTPQPGDQFVGFEVTVLAGNYTLFTVGGDGEIIATRAARFNDFSEAPVDRILAPNGQRFWRTTVGEYTGWSYIKGRSGTFHIRGVYLAPDGERRYAVLPDSEI